MAEHLSKSFGEDPDEMQEVIADISFSLSEREMISIVGPSGCGKTTLLNMLCGLTPFTSGRLFWYGAELTEGAPDSVGYMLQNDMLLPWRTALQNVTLGLEIMNSPTSARREKARALLAKLGLDGFANHYPTKLSGGMRQRVALARTLARISHHGAR
ncbi:MAG: ABC transporter ATP-binding protein [Gammaproteobacteria bacterium]